MREPITDVIPLPTLTPPLVPSFPLAALIPVPFDYQKLFYKKFGGKV